MNPAGLEHPDWFAAAADEAASSISAKRVAKAMAEVSRKMGRTSAEIAAAADAFTRAAAESAPVISPNDPPPWLKGKGWVPGGGAPPTVVPGRSVGGVVGGARVGTGARIGSVGATSANIAWSASVDRDTTPEQGLDAIVRHIAMSEDADEAFKRAGEWITRITNAITTASREFEEGG